MEKKNKKARLKQYRMALIRTVRRIIIINVHRNALSNQVISSHPLMQAI